jgi:hypothetical protein
MKKYLLLFSFFLTQILFGQEYKFDKYYEYENESGSEFFLINSKDTTYSFVGRSYNKEITGYIEDLNKNLRHHYNVKNKNSSIEFEYIKSTIYEKCNLSTCEGVFNYFDLVKTRIDSTKSKINLDIFKNAKKKKMTFRLEIVVSELDTLFLSKNMFSKFYDIGFPDKFDLSLTHLPLSINFKNLWNGYKMNKKLIKNKNINTNLYLKEEAIKFN